MPYDAGETVRDGYEGERDAARAAKLRARPGLDDRKERLQQRMETLDNALETLAHRIGSVLLPERPEAALAGVVQDAPDTSDLGAFFDYMTARVDALGRRAAELSERIDL
jgi:type II secretory pathway component PulJ